MVSRRDVATRAGVSEATVSRVLNGLSVVRADTRARVLAAVEALAYRPSSIAQSFARGLSGNIGVVLPYLPKVHLFSTYYFAEICSGIGQQLARSGYHMLILFSQPDDSATLLQAFATRKVDACILLGAVSDSLQVEQLLAKGYPFCLVSQRHPHEQVMWVDANHVAGARMAVDHLIALGHRRVAFLGGPPQYTNSVDRQQGVLQAHAAAGLDFAETRLLQGNYSRTSGYRSVGKLLAMDPPPTAVFAANDRMAAGLVAGLHEANIQVGRDIAVVGYDDGDIAPIIQPPLTTVHVPFYELGEQAAAMVVAKGKSVV